MKKDENKCYEQSMFYHKLNAQLIQNIFIRQERKMNFTQISMTGIMEHMCMNVKHGPITKNKIK